MSTPPTALLAALALCCPTPAAAQPEGALDSTHARDILFGAEKKPFSTEACAEIELHDQVHCLLGLRFAGDAKAAKIAQELYARTGTIVGVLPEQDFDGAYRGVLHLVPHLPVGADRHHLEWTAAALLDLQQLFDELQKEAKVHYRWSPLEFRFFESVKKRTPSAFAMGWSVSYNVNGSLFGSERGVRETLFHEIFHLNDHAHDDWSLRALQKTYDAIVKKCGTDIKCLTPYSPDGIIVYGGTYYDFMPDNGVREYGADVAKRYFVEHRALLHKEKLGKPFKCIAPENAVAWELVSKEFFGGVDRVPPCGK